jgi:hypothetical protein
MFDTPAQLILYRQISCNRAASSSSNDGSLSECEAFAGPAKMAEKNLEEKPQPRGRMVWQMQFMPTAGLKPGQNSNAALILSRR